jgi:hypothetical protein
MSLVALPFEDDLPHRPEPSTHWQESVVLTWQDISQQVGGFIRIGHRPNVRQATCTFGIVSAEGLCFNRSATGLPMQDSDRGPHTYAVDNFLSATFEDGSSRWRASDGDCEFDLTVADLHPQYDIWSFFNFDPDYRKSYATGHTEVAGRAKGIVRIQGRAWQVDAFTFRDHSWGVRDLAGTQADLSNFFWLVGSFGDELIISSCEIINRAGRRMNTGFVLRDGDVDKPRAAKMSFLVALDGLSIDGAKCVIETDKWGALDLEIAGFGNVILSMEPGPSTYWETGMPGRMRWGDKIGGVHLSSMFNARAGLQDPPVLFNTTKKNGVYRRGGWTPSV